MAMAQMRPVSRSFEQHWRPRLNLAAKVLRDIETRWLRSDEPFPCRPAVAALLNIFTFDFHRARFLTYRGPPDSDLWRRSPEEWLAVVGPPEVELARLSPGRDGATYEAVVEALCIRLARAAESWVGLGPDKPPCEEVTRDMLDNLAAGRFVVVTHG
jgi:hypothetical protein